MIPHPETVCRVTDRRRQDVLLAADRHRLGRSASSDPIRRAAHVVQAERAGLVARLRAWRRDSRVAALGEPLASA